MTIAHNELNNLELTINHNDSLDLIIFSDRPKHLSYHSDMTSLQAAWVSEDDGFGMDPPNAVITITDGNRNICLVVELLTLHLTADSAKFEFLVLQGDEDLRNETGIASISGQGSLVIDDFGISFPNPMPSLEISSDFSHGHIGLGAEAEGLSFSW